MKHVIEAGTDGATLCAFDAAALPGDFDARVESDPMGLMETLLAGDRLWFGGTGSDGSHVVHVLVDEPVVGISARPDWRGHLDVPSGELWVCGAEYIANAPRRGSAFTPSGGLGRYDMGKSITISPGRYAVQVFEMSPVGDNATTRVTTAQWLQVVPLVMYGLGGLAALFAGAALAVSLVLKLGQVLAGSPLADKGWHALPVMLAIACAGVAIVISGRLLSRRIERLPAVALDRERYAAARAARPDIILALQRVADAPGQEQAVKAA